MHKIIIKFISVTLILTLLCNEACFAMGPRAVNLGPPNNFNPPCSVANSTATSFDFNIQSNKKFFIRFIAACMAKRLNFEQIENLAYQVFPPGQTSLPSYTLQKNKKNLILNYNQSLGSEQITFSYKDPRGANTRRICSKNTNIWIMTDYPQQDPIELSAASAKTKVQPTQPESNNDNISKPKVVPKTTKEKLRKLVHIGLSSPFNFFVTGATFWYMLKYFPINASFLLLAAALVPGLTHMFEIMLGIEKKRDIKKLTLTFLTCIGLACYAYAQFLGTVLIGTVFAENLSIGITILILRNLIKPIRSIYSHKSQKDYNITPRTITLLGFSFGLLSSIVMQSWVAPAMILTPIKFILFLAQPILALDKLLFVFGIIEYLQWSAHNNALSAFKASSLEASMALLPALGFVFSYSSSMAALSTPFLKFLAFSGLFLTIVANYFLYKKEKNDPLNKITKASMIAAVFLLLLKSGSPVSGKELAIQAWTIPQLYFSVNTLALVFLFLRPATRLAKLVINAHNNFFHSRTSGNEPPPKELPDTYDTDFSAIGAEPLLLNLSITTTSDTTAQSHSKLDNLDTLSELSRQPLNNICNTIQLIADEKTTNKTAINKSLIESSKKCPELKPKALIIFADELIESLGFFDIEETFNAGFFKDNNIFKDGSIFLYGTNQNCNFIENMILKADPAINTITLEKTSKDKEEEIAEINKVIKLARSTPHKESSANHEFVGLIKGRTQQIITLQKLCTKRKIGMPVVVFANNPGIYSFKDAALAAFIRKYGKNKTAWLCYQHPAERLTTQTAQELHRLLLEKIHFETKA